MSLRSLSLALAALALVLGSLPGAALGAQITISRLEGRVYGPDRKPVERAIVRVFDEGGYREAGRAQTDASGRFVFDLPAGKYVVEADPVADPTLARQRQEFEIMDAPGLSTGQRVNISFILKPSAGARPAGPRFDQQVPAPAKAEYDRALKTIGTDREGGLAGLRKAVELFPDYYEALEVLGTEYVKDNHDEPALVVLQKAVEVNPKGERSYYSLGVANYKLKRFDAAIDAFTHAQAIVKDSPNTTLYLGLSHAQSGHAKEAEELLKRAYGLGATGVPELHIVLANLYRRSGRTKEAAAELRLLLKESPNLRDADKIRGLIDKYEKE